MLLQQQRVDGLVEGLTRNYIPVTVSGAVGLAKGSEITMRLERADAVRCHGKYSSQELSHAVS